MAPTRCSPRGSHCPGQPAGSYAEVVRRASGDLDPAPRFEVEHYYAEPPIRREASASTGGHLWGQNLPCEVYHVDSNEINPLDELNFDAETEDHPMSERQFNNLSPSPGFVEDRGGSYSAYVANWFRKAPSVPNSITAEWAYYMFKHRQGELSNHTEAPDYHGTTPFKLGCAQRNVALARELYGWACGGKWAADHGYSPDTSFENYDFFEPWRVCADLDYWIVPEDLVNQLMVCIRQQHGGNGRKCAFCTPPDDMVSPCVEVSITSTGWPTKVIYSLKRLRDDFCIVSTREAESMTTARWAEAEPLPSPAPSNMSIADEELLVAKYKNTARKRGQKKGAGVNKRTSPELRVMQSAADMVVQLTEQTLPQ